MAEWLRGCSFWIERLRVLILSSAVISPIVSLVSWRWMVGVVLVLEAGAECLVLRMKIKVCDFIAAGMWKL